MLSEKQTAVAEERSSRRQPLTDADAAALLASVETVTVARGKRAETRPAEQVTLADLKRPTGNYRAPMIRRGRTLLVGFHAESLERLA